MNYDADYVEAHLIEAGKSFLRLSAHGTKPSMGRLSLFDFMVLKASEAYPDAEPDLPRQSNNCAQITHMDNVWEWVLCLPDRQVRKVILLRMLVDPYTDRHHYTWRKIGRRMRCNHKTAKSWYQIGLSQIVGRLNSGVVEVV